MLLLSDGSNPSKALQGFLEMTASAIMPLTVEQHLDAPLTSFGRYKVQLELLLQETKKEHPDYNSLQQAVEHLQKTDESLQKSLEDARMYIKIRSIRRSIVKVPLVTSASELDDFVSYGRKLIKEGTLLKLPCPARPSRRQKHEPLLEQPLRHYQHYLQNPRGHRSVH